MDVRKEVQENPVGAEVSALFAVVRPILTALLLSLRDEVVRDYGGHANVLLRQLAETGTPMMESLGFASNTPCMMQLSTEIPKYSSVSTTRYTGTVEFAATILSHFCLALRRAVGSISSRAYRNL
jgi:hypothetical protein